MGNTKLSRTMAVFDEEQLSDPDSVLRDVATLSMGHTSTQLLYSAIELKLFDTLARQPQATLSQLSTAIGIGQHQARVLLIGLASLDLIEIFDCKYSLSSRIKKIWGNEHWNALCNFIRFQAKIVYAGLYDFDKSIRHGMTAGMQYIPGDKNNFYDRIHQDPSIRKAFFDYMSSWTNIAVKQIIESDFLSEHNLIVDVGGGDGTAVIALAERYHNAEFQLIDREGSCNLANDKIRKAGYEDRVALIEKDFVHEALPNNVDCFLFIHQLVIWPPETIRDLLVRAYKSLRPGGRIVILSSMLDDTEDGPVISALDCAYFAALPVVGGMIFTWKEYETWLLEAGFGNIARKESHSWTPHGMVTGIKGETDV